MKDIFYFFPRLKNRKNASLCFIITLNRRKSPNIFPEIQRKSRTWRLLFDSEDPIRRRLDEPCWLHPFSERVLLFKSKHKGRRKMVQHLMKRCLLLWHQLLTRKVFFFFSCQVNFIYSSQNHTSLFASTGFTICSAYHTVCPSSLHSDTERLSKSKRGATQMRDYKRKRHILGKCMTRCVGFWRL